MLEVITSDPDAYNDVCKVYKEAMNKLTAEANSYTKELGKLLDEKNKIYM